MAHKNFNRMRGTATAPGTGSFTLAVSIGAAQTFGARLASTNKAWYVATDNVSRWEVGYGTFTSPTTLARTTILESSNSDLVVDFSSGAVDIFCDLPASVLDTLNLIEEIVASASTADLGSIQGKCIELTGTTTVNSFGPGKNKERLVRYTGAGLTISHQATLLCPYATSLSLVTGAIFYTVSDNSATPIWRIEWVLWPTAAAECAFLGIGATGTSATGQIAATATNDSAAAGKVGEYTSGSRAFGSAISLTNNVGANVVTLSLTAGDWDVWGEVYFLPNTGTIMNSAQAGVSVVSTTPSATPGLYSSIYYAGLGAIGTSYGGGVSQEAPKVRISLSATTNIFLVANANFTTNTLTAFGGIQARRVR
jgi:hypothetical protein